MKIHATAIIDPSAQLGEDVEVQPYSIVEADVKIGAGTVIGPHNVIGAGTVMGANNRTFSGAQIGVMPQDLKHLMGVAGNTVIGDGNIFREFVTVSSSTVYSDDETGKCTEIGSNGLFMACTHIAHDCKIGSRVIMANNTPLAGHVTVQDSVIIGGLTGVHQFCVIGRNAFVGGMARVNRDVLPYMIVEGHPPRCIGPNSIGLERAGFSKETIAELRKIYKILHRSKLNVTQALEQVEAEIAPSEERDIILNFIRTSERGITK